jgi:DNA polymerase-1
VSKKPEHVFLIDGSGFIFRAYYGIKADMTRPDGTRVNAVYGFTRMLMKLIEDTDADHVAVIFDHARKTFRNDIYPDYKANRSAPPEDLIPQFDLVRDATRALNVAAVDLAGYEADDLIATYTRQALEQGADVTIVSSDKDLMQLVRPGVVMFDAMKEKIIGPDQVREKFGVGPDKVIEVQALAGDASDNIPGISGIGVKTAAQLINEYGDLETLLARASEIKQPKRRQNLIDEADAARLSRRLVTLMDDVPVEIDLSTFAVQEIKAETLLRFLAEQNFKSLIGTAEARFGVSVQSGAPAETDATTNGAGPGAEYELVQTVAALEGWIAEAVRVGFVAVDTETTSLDAMRAELVGVSLSVEDGCACYIPLGHKQPAAQGALDLGGDGDSGGGGDVPDQIPLNKAVKLLKPMLEDPSVLKIGQNIKYDMKVLSRYGITIAPIDDTMLLSYVLGGGLHGHGMDDLAERELGLDTIKYADVTGTGKAKVTFDLVGLDKALDYAAEDADITGRLHRVLKPRLVRDHMVGVYETLERPLVPVLFEMERTGIKVDGKELKRLSDDFATRLAVLEIDIHKLAGREFNIASPKQLGEILFDELGLPGGKKGKTGAYGTGVEVLEALVDHGHDLPARVLDWRQLAKLKSTYSDALMEQINPDTGRVHTSYSQGAVSTGRLASSNPNLQNIPVRTEEGRKIRRAFIADKGMVFLSADYSQIELRLLAHVADIKVLKDAFHDGQDIHAMTASQVFGVPLEGMDPMVRRKAKAINFGIIYGISAFGLARQLGIGNSEAGEYIDAYFEKYPGIRDYMERTKDQARQRGYVETLFGRKCHIKSINEKNPNVRGLGERAAINAPIQGGAADIIKRAMVRLPDALDGAKLKARMLLQVHDELIFEVPKKELDATAGLVSEVMASAAHLDVPLVVDTGAGDNWDEAH